MRRMLLVLAIGLVAVLFTVPDQASSQVLTVCRRFVADRSCYKCSEYFYVDSEDEAQQRCAKLGAQPYYFPGVRAMERWILGNCPCRGFDPVP